MKKAIVYIVGLLLLVSFSWSTAGHAACKVGEKTQVLWKSSWYPATVKKVKGNECFVHYDGYDNKWDEWVGPDRMKTAGGKEQAAAGGEQGYKKGDAVQVNWKGQWWPAQVIAVGKGKWKVHYDGYESSWDEWVGPDRIK